MTLENILAIVCFIFALVCYVGYLWGSKNTYLKYKEQRVGGLKNE